MPKLRTGPVRRPQVFRVATEVISRESFCGTTIQKVADAVGVSTGTVNHYFANKRAMLIATLAHLAEEWNTALRCMVQKAEPGMARLTVLVDAVGPTTSINKVRWKVWTAAWSEAVISPEIRTALRRSRERWISMLAEMFEIEREIVEILKEYLCESLGPAEGSRSPVAMVAAPTARRSVGAREAVAASAEEIAKLNASAARGWPISS